MDLKWREVYEVGVEEIDKQHKHLFELFVKVYDTPMHEKGLILKPLMEELLDYANYHFENEIKYLKKQNLPKDLLKIHIEEHNKYRVYINKLLSGSIDGMFLTMNTIDFLKDWIIDHILGIDQEHIGQCK